MTFSGDHLEPRSHWSKARSNITLGAIVLLFVLLLADAKSRGYALVGLALMITIMLHEAGHFMAAKWAGMKADEFFVGFGPRIWSFKKGETEYGIKAVPFGGYVRIIGMTDLDEIEAADEARTYRKGKTHKKLIVILAGVTVNIILAFFLFYIPAVVHGNPTDSGSDRAKIETVTPGSAADNAGIQQGDIITKVGDTKTPTFDDVAKQIKTYEVGDKLVVKFERDGKVITASSKLTGRPTTTGKASDVPYLGVVRAVNYKRVNPIAAIGQSASDMKNTLTVTVSGMGRLFSPSGISNYSKTVVNGDYASQERPSSIVGIVNVGGDYVNQDIWFLFSLMALVNIFLAFLNVLPILPLDGGHAAVAIYESVASRLMKRKVHANFKKLTPFITVFVGILVLFIVSSLWLDVLQITS